MQTMEIKQIVVKGKMKKLVKFFSQSLLIMGFKKSKVKKQKKQKWNQKRVYDAICHAVMSSLTPVMSLLTPAFRRFKLMSPFVQNFFFISYSCYMHLWFHKTYHHFDMIHLHKGMKSITSLAVQIMMFALELSNDIMHTWIL